MKRLLGICILITLLAAACSFAVCEENKTINSIQTIIDDMTLPHDDKMHGIPAGYDWASYPRVGLGVNVIPGRFGAFTAWGQIYETADGNPAVNTRVQIRDIKAYYLSKKTGEWTVLQANDKIDGDAYVENFVNDVSVRTYIRDESQNGGGISVTAGNGYNFHFWSRARAIIHTHDVAALFTTYQARLIVDDETKEDDRDIARYLAGCGGDYWRDTKALWAPGFTANGDFAIGRMKLVTKEWQAFNAYAGSFDILKDNPPPLE